MTYLNRRFSVSPGSPEGVPRGTPLLADVSSKALVEVPLPLLGALTSSRNAFFELCVDAGRQVLGAMMEQDREWLCGPLWKRDPGRVAGRAGTTPSAVTLGGRRVRVDRPRVRNRDGEEVELPSFAFASSRDALDDRTLEAMALGGIDPEVQGAAAFSSSVQHVLGHPRPMSQICYG